MSNEIDQVVENTTPPKSTVHAILSVMARIEDFIREHRTILEGFSFYIHAWDHETKITGVTIKGFNQDTKRASEVARAIGMTDITWSASGSEWAWEGRAGGIAVNLQDVSSRRTDPRNGSPVDLSFFAPTDQGKDEAAISETVKAEVGA